MNNEEIEKEFENNIYLPKLRDSLNELKKELLGKTLDENDVELISNSYEGLIKGIIKQVVPIVQKALSLKEQEDWKLKEDYHKAVIAYGELDEKYRELKKLLSSLQEKIEKLPVKVEGEEDDVIMIKQVLEIYKKSILKIFKEMGK